MSSSWFLVSMYLIWISGSKLIQSNNQSRATLWVLETCFIVGLLPFMIILITASLSSKIFNIASLREEFAFEETKSTLPHQCISVLGFSTSFAFERSSGQWTRGSEYWVFAFCKCQHHVRCNSVPFSLWFVFESRIPFLF